MRCDLFSVEASVFNKDLAGARTGHDYTGYVDARKVAFERYGIADGTVLLGRQIDPNAGQEIVIGVVSGQRKNEVIFQALRTSRSVEHNEVRTNLEDSAIEIGRNLTGLDAVLDVRPYPILHVRMNLGAAVDHCHASSMPPEIKRGLSCGIFAADDDHIVIEIRMRLAIVMKNFGKILAGNAHLIGQIVIARRDNDFPGTVIMNVSLPIGGNHMKIAVLTVDGLHPLVLANLQVVVLCSAPVIFERFQTSRFHESASEWDVANLKQLGRSKKGHVSRIVEDRIDQASLFQDECFEKGCLVNSIFHYPTNMTFFTT